MNQVKVFVFISRKKQGEILVFISWLVSFGFCIQIKYICDVVRNKHQTINIHFSQSKEDQKFKKRMSCEHGLNFDQWKHFPKTICQWEFDYGLFTNFPRIIFPWG